MSTISRKIRNLLARSTESNVGDGFQPPTSSKRLEIDGYDRAEWDAAWRKQSHRNLELPLKIGLKQFLGEDNTYFGRIVSATISEDPPEYSGDAFRNCEECPVCGETTFQTLRRAAHIHPQFENGFDGISFGVWVHSECFENSSDTGIQAPIPW